jgi:2'-hydroxyisoflavone reductase
VKLLILGGTAFLGRHVTEIALERGHDVTLFNRGKRNPELFPNVEKLRGERDSDLAPLQGRRWDAVVDTCGYVPRVVEKTARLFANTGTHYTFISSLSVYADFSNVAMDESSPVGVLVDPDEETITGESYGPLKALCERTVQKEIPGLSLCVRAGLIVGPDDYTGRFGYWPKRVAEGGNVLSPGDPQTAIQFIDVRDLAGWIVTMAERRQGGVYNATGPAQPLSMKDFLDTCRNSTREVSPGAERCAVAGPPPVDRHREHSRDERFFRRLVCESDRGRSDIPPRGRHDCGHPLHASR